MDEGQGGNSPQPPKSGYVMVVASSFFPSCHNLYGCGSCFRLRHFAYCYT